jgi:hypothetical protein
VIKLIFLDKGGDTQRLNDVQWKELRAAGWDVFWYRDDIRWAPLLTGGRYEGSLAFGGANHFPSVDEGVGRFERETSRSIHEWGAAQRSCFFIEDETGLRRPLDPR